MSGDTAEQDVLSVVKNQIISLKGTIALSPAGGKLERGRGLIVRVRILIGIRYAARPPAELLCALEYGGWDTALCQRDSSGHARVAATDNSYVQFLSHVL